ncbi:hypothetical protein Tco_0112137 [Tanacetum coccineum]
MNGKKPLTLDFKTFTTSTSLHYNNGEYVAHPSPQAVKAELAKIVDIGKIIYNDLVTKLINKSKQKYIYYPRFVSCALEVLLGTQYNQDENFGSLPGILSNSNFSKDPSKVTEIELTAHMIAGPEASGALSKKRQKPKSKKTPTKTQVTSPTGPIEGSEQSHSVSSGMVKTTPCPEGVRRDKVLEGLKPPADIKPLTNPVADPLRTGAKYQESDNEELFAAGEEMDEDIPPTDEEVQSPPPNTDKPESSQAQNSDESDSDSSSLELNKYDNILPLTERQLWEKHEEATVSYVDLRASIEGYYKENVDHRDQTDKLVQATINSLDKNSTERADLLKALNMVNEILKTIQEAVKEDPALHKKVLEATEAYTTNSNNITELLSLAKTFDFFGLKSLVENVKAALDAHNDNLATWTKSSTSMAWNVGPRLTKIKHTLALMQADLSSLKSDTLEIKSTMTKIYQAFKGQSSTPSSSVPQTTLAINEGPENVGGDNVIHADTKEPPSHTEGEHVTMEDDTEKAKSDKAEEEPTREVPISIVRPIIRPNPKVALIESLSRPLLTDPILEIHKLVPVSKVIQEDPDEPIRVPYMINGKMYYFTNDEINAHLEKEDKIKKATEEAKMLEMTKTEVIKVVQEEAEKIGLDPKTIVSAKACEKFKKAQDAEHQVLKRELSQKVKRLMELNKKRDEQYMWTISNRLKPEPITDFSDFGVTRLDELGPIIQNKKNTIVKDLMISLGKRYERLKKIPEELGIHSTLLAPIPEQAPSQSSGRKRKHMELEPEIKVPGLECNRSLPEGVLFVNNMVIEEPEYRIFFTDVFGDQAF